MEETLFSWSIKYAFLCFLCHCYSLKSYQTFFSGDVILFKSTLFSARHSLHTNSCRRCSTFLHYCHLLYLCHFNPHSQHKTSLQVYSWRPGHEFAPTLSYSFPTSSLYCHLRSCFWFGPYSFHKGTRKSSTLYFLIFFPILHYHKNISLFCLFSFTTKAIKSKFVSWIVLDKNP